MQPSSAADADNAHRQTTAAIIRLPGDERNIADLLTQDNSLTV